MATQKLVAKLSAKSIGIDFAKAKTAPQDQFDVLGYATDIKEGESTYGKWTALVGNFEATNIATGEVFVSTQCFLPAIVNDLVASQIKQGNPVQFAYRIGTVPADSTVGYEYTVSALVEAEPLEILDAIRGKISLPAPKKNK